MRLGLRDRRRSTGKKVFRKRKCCPNGVTAGRMDVEMGNSCIATGPGLREACLPIFFGCQDSVLASCIFAP